MGPTSNSSIPTLYRACKSAAFCDASYIDSSNAIEKFCRQLSAKFNGYRGIRTEFLEGREVIGDVYFTHTADIWLTKIFLFGFFEPNLVRVVAVAIFGQNLSDFLIFNLEQSDSDQMAVFIDAIELVPQNLGSAQGSKSHLLIFNDLDENIDARWKVSLHKRINSLWASMKYIEHALVCTNFKLLTALFVNVRTTQNCVTSDACW